MLKKTAKNFINDESGQGMVEYGLILALIAVVVIGVMSLVGDEVKEIFTKIKNALKVTNDSDDGIRQ